MFYIKHFDTQICFTDEAAPKRFQDDTVRDERGRRRFHGAFTGGFSAGYFNSVGTKEGWTPQNFVSSRSQRAETTGGQRPEDFMDSEVSPNCNDPGPPTSSKN